MRPTFARLRDRVQRLSASHGRSRGFSLPAIFVVPGVVLLLLVAVARSVQAGLDLARAAGGSTLAVPAGQLTAPPGTLELVLEFALVLGIVAVFLMSWRTQRIAAVAIDAARGGSATERWRQAVSLLGLVSEDGNPSIEARLGAIYTLEQIPLANSGRVDDRPFR